MSAALDTELYDVGGTKVSCTNTGAGRPVVMIHGGGPGASSLSNFRQNIPALADRYRLLLIDLPGYGHSGPAVLGPDETMFGYYARCVKELLDTAGVGVVDMVGNSLGGSTSFRFALDYPDRVRRLVLMGPGGVAMPVFAPGAKMAAAMGSVAARLSEEPSAENMRAFIATMVFDDKAISDAVIAERLKDLEQQAEHSPLVKTWRAAAGSRIDWDRRDFEIWTRCEEVGHPTLFLWGRDDQINPLDGALYPLQYMPNAELHSFSRCGHWAQVECAAEFDLVVREFLERPDSGAR